ncbi:hypothetical protein [Kitasatospora sp. NPDC059827]|uniref:hypothetical protein n=1 Tax=Kitasatospora sp. NPDC059827 TaxID=3346964 RepID=UPI00364EF0C8
MTIELSQEVHVINGLGQAIYVLMAPHPERELEELYAEVPLLSVRVGEVKSIAETADLPDSLATFADLARFLKGAGPLLESTSNAGRTAAGPVIAAVEAVQKNATRIAAGESVTVRAEWDLSPLSTPAAGQSETGMVSLLIVSGDGALVSDVSSEPDDYWLAARDGLYHAGLGRAGAVDGTSEGIPWMSIGISLNSGDSRIANRG